MLWNDNQRGRLGGVVGVDADVLGGEVAGEEAGGGFAGAEVEGDGVFGGGHGGVGGVLVEAGGAATVLKDGVIADPDAGAVGIELGAGVAGGGDEASPVGVGGGPGGFAEWALGDGAGCEAGVGFGGCAADVEGDEVGDAFAVGDDLAGEREADVGEGGIEGGRELAGERDAGGSAGEQQDGVVGGGVAVDGDGVEAGLDGGVERGAEGRSVGGDVGEEVDEQGGVRGGFETWADHAGAFGGSPDADGAGRRGVRCGDGEGRAGHFDASVGGHDGTSEGGGVGGGVAGGLLEPGDGGEDFFSGEWDADDAGGGGDDLVEDAAKGLGGGDAGGDAAFDSLLSGGAVGVAGVDQEGSDAASGGGDVAAANDDGGGDDAVGGEHGCADGSGGGDGEGEVGIAGELDAGGGCAPEKAARDVFGVGGGYFGGHALNVSRDEELAGDGSWAS